MISTEINNNGKFKNLDLPATYSQIQDALHLIGADEIADVRGRISNEEGASSLRFRYKECNIYELNYLAEKLENLEHLDAHKFVGAYYLKENEMNLEKAINLVLNIEQYENIDVFPARDEEELAEFYIECDLIPELKNLRAESFDWIVEHLDYEKIGQKLVEQTEGSFYSGNYVAVDELVQIYDGNFTKIVPENYIFEVEFGYVDEKPNDLSVILTLPTDNEIFNQIFNDFNVEDVDKINVYSFKSIIPTLEYMDFDASDINTLNNLAKNIENYKENDKINTFKAMIDTLEVISLEKVMKLCDFVEDFTLDSSVLNENQYGKEKFLEYMPKEMVDCIDTTNYSLKKLEDDKAQITAYGALIPKDSISLEEKMSEEKPKFNMTMN